MSTSSGVRITYTSLAQLTLSAFDSPLLNLRPLRVPVTPCIVLYYGRILAVRL